MSSLSCQWLSGPYAYPSGRFCNLSSSNTSLAGFTIYCSNSQFTPRAPGPESSKNDLKFVLHDALDASGVNTTHARVCIFVFDYFFIRFIFCLILVSLI